MATASYMPVICVIINLLRWSSAVSFPVTLKVSAAMTRLFSPPFLYIFLIAFFPPFFASLTIGKTNWPFSRKDHVHISELLGTFI